MHETTVTITGNVITDLKRRYTAEGAELVTFRVASNERRMDRSTGEWKDGETLYVNVTCWRRLVTGVSAALGKGDPVIVTGRLYTRSYEVEGQRRSSTELDASAVGIDLSRCIATILRERKAAPPQEGGAEAVTDDDPVAVDVPDTAEELGAEEPVLA